MPDHDADAWEPLRSELATEVGRVADRLRSMSQARLEGQVAAQDGEPPLTGTRAAAGRGLAKVLSDVAGALEAAATGSGTARAPDMPELNPFATGDQVAVGGHDLLAALDLVGPDVEVAHGDARSAWDAVAYALGLLTDLRRRL